MPYYSDPSVKYKPFINPIKLPDRKWPSNTLQKAPRWLATDLRDGNQSLPDPMSLEEKKLMLNKLCEMGFKEIEVAFPSASNVDFQFTQYAVKTVPDDVYLQVLSPCREELICKTVESLKGAKNAIVHIYLATSACFREIVFNNMSQKESIEKAVKCTQLVRSLTKDNPDAQSTNWSFEFSPETFSDSDPVFVIEVCEAVKRAWGPTRENPIIFNLPATVEMSTPNIYADEIEYFCRNISERDTVCVSLHPHNDRGCAVAAAELAQMAGADRVEGCLFGNGERTGNVDLVTLALNLYTQGVSPNLDFHDMKSIIDVVEKCTKLPVHPRAPYGGQLVVCAFSGSHQDAIKKGFQRYEADVARAQGALVPWRLPYLPLDPEDIGRTYEAIIRVNSQSGKGGASWIILRNLQLDLPRGLQVAFSKVAQDQAESMGRELRSNELCDLFESAYYMGRNKQAGKYSLVDYEFSRNKGSCSLKIFLSVHCRAGLEELTGEGNGPISCFINAINSKLHLHLDVQDYHEHSLGKDSKSKAATFISVSDSATKDHVQWGVGIHEDVTQASFLSLISCLNCLHRDNLFN
ncbi:probable 2-isopropylmalalate synthase [Zygosaccharomyces bailii ISA1307]|nr:probable 2-isopropylmalalate synthase [Zygosaccharomyces bailii ISA1307]